MATCPQGHASSTDDYCDVCGTQMSAPAPQQPGPSQPQGSRPAESCPICATPRVGQFCEVCGHSFDGGALPAQTPAAGARWEAVTAADRAYYDQVIAQNGPDAAAMAFPPYCPERSFPLIGEQVRIGRSRRGRDLTPEIDLAGPPTDPGVSGLHAVLLATPGGTWMLVDPGSANGTQVNGKPVTVNVPVPVGPGDRIHLGAWTVITIREGTP
ncbi:FHA domain-containing protein [Nonomuraea ferruginea]|uniref:FHA domain-containing protein n=1 Tax=Nonomuraea ferruginea TaxID=46174 RepID=A0ABT4STC6_9ACTN|nr:FHA domain-containing protein [Nonomuraea ferruginea]MDA0640516.1 FHA domain-containing protein [Nonomuraea ferruginea]